MGTDNSSKGASRLAEILQLRIKAVMKRSLTVTAEFGAITGGKCLKVDSLPDYHLSRNDYSVCSAYEKEMEEGDRVLVIWTNDGEPVVLDKIV